MNVEMCSFHLKTEDSLCLGCNLFVSILVSGVSNICACVFLNIKGSLDRQADEHL